MVIHRRVSRCRGMVLLVLFVGTVAVFAEPVSLYVSRDGNDAWSGRLERPNRRKTDGPFATVPRAAKELAVLRAANALSEGASVYLREGTYFLSEPLVFGPGDSGTEAAPITFSAYKRESVRLKGSVPVTGWELRGDGVYRADLSQVTLGSAPLAQLFWNGERQPLARVPNVDPQHPRSGGFAYVTGVVEKDSKTLLQYDPNRIKPEKWAAPDRARVHIWSWLNWNRSVCPITSLDTETNVITLLRPASYKLITGNRYFIENVFEEMDAPGEWYYDEAAKGLYFRPPDGRDPEGKVSVPVLSHLVQIQGVEEKDLFVSHIRLHRLQLSEAEQSLIRLDMASHCRISASTLRNGGKGVHMAKRSHHNTIEGCDIAHVTGVAITLDGKRDFRHRLERGMSHNLVTNNHVHHVGEGGNAWGAITITPGCGGNVTHDNVVSHNLVHDTPRQGISFNGFRNTVEYNHVHHTNQEQSDTGAIGMGSRDIYERGSIVRYNYIHDTGGYNMVRPGIWEYPHYCWGVYLDDYTSGVHVYGNIIVRTYRGGVMVHGGQDNVIENNIIVDGLGQQVQYMPIDSVTSGRTKGHPDTSMWLMTGTRFIGNIVAYSGEKSHYAAGRKWEQCIAESDRNLIWHNGLPLTLQKMTPTEGKDYWETWGDMGFEKNSVIADPLFVAPEKDDYRLRRDSPAFALGFKRIPVEMIGLQKSPDRASWPVADDCWRETHLTEPVPGFTPAASIRKSSAIPKLVARHVSVPPVIDGCADAREWGWAAPGAKVAVEALSMGEGSSKCPSHAIVVHDREALYIAMVSSVTDTAKLVRSGGVWGRDDGAEVCIQDASGAKPGPVFVIQGYPSGKVESVDHAGAPLPAVRRLGAAVTYAAAVTDSTWTGEWRIPFAALGIDPAAEPKLRFNLGVLKREEKQWAAWISTGGAPWKLDFAGELLLSPTSGPGH